MKRNKIVYFEFKKLCLNNGTIVFNSLFSSVNR